MRPMLCMFFEEGMPLIVKDGTVVYHGCIWHRLAAICDASFNYGLWAPSLGKGVLMGLKMESLSSPVVTSHINIRRISHRFRSAPTCHGQTHRRTDGIRRQFYRPPNTRTLHWNWPLFHTAKHCFCQSNKDQATIGLCCSDFLVFSF